MTGKLTRGGKRSLAALVIAAAGASLAFPAGAQQATELDCSSDIGFWAGSRGLLLTSPLEPGGQIRFRWQAGSGNEQQEMQLRRFRGDETVQAALRDDTFAEGAARVGGNYAEFRGRVAEDAAPGAATVTVRHGETTVLTCRGAQIVKEEVIPVVPPPEAPPPVVVTPVGRGFPVVAVGIGAGVVAALFGIVVARRTRRQRVEQEGEIRSGCRCNQILVERDSDFPGEGLRDVGAGTVFRLCLRVRCVCSGRIGDTCQCGLKIKSAKVTFTPPAPGASSGPTVNIWRTEHCSDVQGGEFGRTCGEARFFGVPGVLSPDAPTEATVEWELEKWCDGPAGRAKVTQTWTWSGASSSGTLASSKYEGI